MICNVENLRHFRPNVRNKGDSSRAILTLQLQSLRRGNHGHHRPRTRIPLRCCACDSSSQSSAVTICYYLLHTYIHCHLSPGITSGYRHDLSAKSSHVSDAIRALFYIEKSHYIYRRTLSFNISRRINQFTFNVQIFHDRRVYVFTVFAAFVALPRCLCRPHKIFPSL